MEPATDSLGAERNLVCSQLDRRTLEYTRGSLAGQERHGSGNHHAHARSLEQRADHEQHADHGHGSGFAANHPERAGDQGDRHITGEHGEAGPRREGMRVVMRRHGLDADL